MRALALLLVLGVATSAAAAGTTQRTRVHGVVTRGPVVPVCIEGKPCDLPAKHVRLAFLRGGRVVARVKTGNDGRYGLRLRAGRYAVRIALNAGTTFQPRAVKVPRARAYRLDFSIDTGIR